MLTKTTSDLRGMLIEDLEQLRKGKITKAEARTRAYVAKNIVDTLKVEIAAMSMNVDHFGPVLLDAAHGAKTLTIVNG